MHFEELYQKLLSEPAYLQEKLKQDTQIAGDALPRIIEQSQKYAEWGYVHARAEVEAKRAKYVWQEEVAAACREVAKSTLISEGKKTTQKNVEDYSVVIPKYLKAREHYLQAEQFAGICKHAVEAMRHRLSMVQSMNSRQKSEIEALK